MLLLDTVLMRVCLPHEMDFGASKLKRQGNNLWFEVISMLWGLYLFKLNERGARIIDHTWHPQNLQNTASRCHESMSGHVVSDKFGAHVPINNCRIAHKALMSN
jgi:hypothetical protein